MDIPETPLIAPGGAPTLREQERESMFLLTTIRFDGMKKPLSTRVRNVSRGGMMVDATLPVQKGQRLVAELKHIGDIDGRVAWVAPTRIGIAFDEDIDPKLTRQPVGVGTVKTNYTEALKPERRPGLAIR